MQKNDLRNAMIIGVSVGVLFQAVIANLLPDIQALIPVSETTARVGFFLFFTVLAPAALWIASLIGKVLPVAYQFAKFAAVGSLNSFVDLGALNLLIFLTGINDGPQYTVFAVLSALAGTVNSFFWNKLWTFGAAKSGQTIAQVIQFYVVTGVALLINSGTASFVVNVIGRPDAISSDLWANMGKIAGIFAGMMFNFLGYKYIVFGKPVRAVADMEEKAKDWLRS